MKAMNRHTPRLIDLDTTILADGEQVSVQRGERVPATLFGVCNGRFVAFSDTRTEPTPSANGKEKESTVTTTESADVIKRWDRPSVQLRGRKK